MQSLSVKKNEVASSTVSQFTYAVNHLGQRTGVTTTGSAFANVNRGWTWGYDALGQVTKAVHADAPATLDRAYAYDNIGNRTSSTDGSGGGATTVAYTPDRLNQYDTINPGAPADPVYDLDGNLKDDAGINAMGYGLKLEWDAENRPTAVRKADDTLLATYVYDHLGRRIRKTTTAAASQGASDIAYLYEGWNVVAEYAIASGPGVSLAQAYTWGLDLSGSGQGAGGVGGLLCIHRGPGTDGSGERTWTAAFYPTYDGNGNISEYLEYQVDIDPGTSGNQPGTVAVAHFEYDPFGRIAASSGAVADFTYRFSTKPQDFETGLYYYGYRFYDPVTGRWPSRDPIEEEGGVNLYGFVENRPLSSVDFLGNQSITLDRTGAVVWDANKDGICDKCDYDKITKGKEFLLKNARDHVVFMKDRAAKLPDYIRPAGSEGTKFEESCGQLNVGYFRGMEIPDCWVCYMEHRANYDPTRPRKERWHDHWWITCVAFDDSGEVADEFIIDFWRKGVNPGDSPMSNRQKWPVPATSEAENAVNNGWPHKDSSGRCPNFPATDLEGIPTKEEQDGSGLPPNLKDQGKTPKPEGN
jgi:RHS repeat-associated protein